MRMRYVILVQQGIVWLHGLAQLHHPRACSIVNYIINTSFIIHRHQLGYIPSAAYSNSLSWLYY